MRSIILILLCLTVLSVSTGQASCIDDYRQRIVEKTKSGKKVKKIGRIGTGTVAGVSGAFWTYMGIALVGPWGILIGAQFALASALPVGIPFYIVNKVKKNRLKNLGRMVQIIQESRGEEIVIKKGKPSPLRKLFKKLKKRKPDLTLAALKEEVITLDDIEALCDGTVSRHHKIILKSKRSPFATPYTLYKWLRKKL